MKNVILSSLFTFSVCLLMLMMNILNSTCSGNWNYNNSLNTFDSSPLNAPEFNGEYDWSEHTAEETLAGSNNTRYGGLSYSVKKAKLSSQSNSPNFMFNYQTDRWTQATIEEMFVSSGPRWPHLDRDKNFLSKIKIVTEICIALSRPVRIPMYNRICNKFSRFGPVKRLRIKLQKKGVRDILNRVMLSCTCYDEHFDGGEKENEHTFLIAYHTDTSYFLLKYYPEDKKNIFIFGFVENIILPYNKSQIMSKGNQ